MKQAPTRLEILEEVRWILDKPENWIKGSMAHDAQGERVYPTSPTAVSFCIYGACLKAGMNDSTNNIYGAINRVEKDYNFLLSAFNDSSTHPQVLAFLDRLIEFETMDSTDLPWEL